MPSSQISLILLTVQNSALILIMHYSRIMPLVDGHRYFTSTAVFLNEVLKLSVSLTLALYDIAINAKTPDNSTAAALFSELARAVFTGDSWKMAIPAVMYTIQNSLQYSALSNLDAATFQVTYQLKILTTAIFSVTVLGKALNGRKWLSLVLLMVGVAIFQIPAGASKSAVLSMKDLTDGAAFHEARNIWDLKAHGNVAAGQLSKRSATYEGIEQDFEASKPDMNPMIGVGEVVVACVLSGLAGVYFEKILKDNKSEHKASLWVRNVQLSFYSLWPALFVGVLFKDGEHIARAGFFAGYNWVVWTAILFQAMGGVLVAFVINYANNIAKNFATSFSIIISFLASVFFFDFQVTPFTLLGTAVVLFATYLYSSGSDDKQLRAPPISVSEHEKSNSRTDEHGYFDLETVVTPARSPALRGVEALATSRPVTPTYERRYPKAKSSEVLGMSKREQ